MSKTIYGWNDLSRYGITCLTGEADPYGMRLLCDLTEQGHEIISQFFGVPKLQGLPSNWNSGAIHSILLSRELLVPLAKFILFHVEKFSTVIIDKQYGVHGGFWNDNQLDVYQKMDSIICHNPNRTGLNRNEHQFTGRTY